MHYPEKYIVDLNEKEIIGLHLDSSYSINELKDSYVRCTLSFLLEAIQHCRHNNHTKNLVPIMSSLSMLEQIGICYERTDLNTNFTNGIKRALILFGEYESDDDLLDILPALRNGLLHNVSLVSKAKYPNQSNYIFRYSNENDNLSGVYQNSPRIWDGNFGTLSAKGREHYTTLINTDELNDLLYKCLNNAEELNNKGLLKIKLDGGKEELFYNYLRSKPK
ncbi:hypothetical protein [Tenacibaculum crassostreae]|uniref:hypothetical protein n=1 Tax=Tenacibaculum crassostreae TaxID=502683 RepID=UPI003896046B